MKPKTMTGAEVKVRLLPDLLSLRDDDEVFFGGGDLSLHRVKERGPVDGPRLVQIEFNELYTVHSDLPDTSS